VPTTDQYTIVVTDTTLTGYQGSASSPIPPGQPDEICRSVADLSGVSHFIGSEPAAAEDFDALIGKTRAAVVVEAVEEGKKHVDEVAIAEAAAVDAAADEVKDEEKPK